MTTVAYAYCNPLLDSPTESYEWGDAVACVYEDLGDRSQLEHLIRDCETPNTDSNISESTKPKRLEQVPIDTVIIRQWDELGDTVEEVSDRLQTFQSLGIVVHSLENDTEDCLATIRPSTDRLAALSLFKTIQQNQAKQQIRKGHARNRLKGLPPPGKAPFGYRRGKERYALDRSTAPIVKDFVEHFLLYGSLRGSVRYLAKKHNKKISVSTGQRWLTSPVYRGDLMYCNGDVIPDTHLAIISRDEAAQIDRLLRRNRKLPPRTASAPRSLAGLVKCATCGSAMKITRTTTRSKSKEYVYLSPVNCLYHSKQYASENTQKLNASAKGVAVNDTASKGGFLKDTGFIDAISKNMAVQESELETNESPVPCRSLIYEHVLHRTIQHICETLPEAISRAKLPDLDSVKQRIQHQIDAKQNILQQIPNLQASEILDADTAKLRAYTIRTEIAELQAQQAQLPPPNLIAIAQTVSIPQFWLDLSEEERRFYFREFIESIQIVRYQSTSTTMIQSPAWDLRLVFMF